ncbi:MAG: hypothetical protein IJ083_00595 [Clostridia bacterium]|nr:hypothetical protein [Clostridia bacterium]
MTTKDFMQHFDLHDGSLENIEFDRDRHTLDLTISLPHWKLTDLREEEAPETVGMDGPETAVLHFRGASLLSGYPGRCPHETILQAWRQAGRMSILLCDEISGKTHRLEFSADTVELTAA